MFIWKELSRNAFLQNIHFVFEQKDCYLLLVSQATNETLLIMTEGRKMRRLQDEDDNISNPSMSYVHSLCGPNTEFVVSVEASTKVGVSLSSPTVACKCKPGYDGNPLDMSIGCKKSSKLRLTCEYKNKSYGIEETFFDGCDKKCVCSEALEVDCVPRCPDMESICSSTDVLCSLVEDPKDSCCKVLSCESQAATEKTAHPSSSVLTTTTPPINSGSSSKDDPLMDASSSSSPLNRRSTLSMNIPTNQTDGCRLESNPGFFRNIGEVFSVNCDLKCVCTNSGVTQCEPQCSIAQGECNTNFLDK